ncbi:hypothetical protein ABKV19_020670 [Rosa sericea]
MATATYPPPPPYYKLYKDYLQDPKSAPEQQPPIEGTYICYGANYTTDDLLPSLEEQGVRQLYPKGPNIDAGQGSFGGYLGFREALGSLFLQRNAQIFSCDTRSTF